MSFLFLVSAALLSTLSAAARNTDSCLPAGIKPTDVVSAQAVKPAANRDQVRTITVAQKLKDLRARCRKRKLVDAGGKEIRFYRLIGCWGNPPEDYQEQLERQAKELAKLRKRYRVIEMTCNPSGQQIVQVHSLEVNRQKPDRSLVLSHCSNQQDFPFLIFHSSCGFLSEP